MCILALHLNTIITIFTALKKSTNSKDKFFE